ncbi:MAG: prolipoprotein diacylglyceryl transferase [Rhodobacteraceae bacterium]|nr:prolipoprotein diacylglyceryl transferase [Paracoccaceae bacterium]
MSYIPFPNISPEIFSFEVGGVTLALRWYALAYIVGLLAGWKLITRIVTTQHLWNGSAPANTNQIERLLTWVIFGVILGGRTGYVLFYQPFFFLQNPTHVLRVWEGGMSFHGGFIGVMVASIIFSRNEKIPILSLADLIAVAAPIGLFLGRVANFINAELWGRPTNLPWGVVFPGEAAQTCKDILTVCARHPSQLYEAALEGLLLGALLLWAVWRGGWLQKPGRLLGLFLANYGLTRFAVEFVRQADAQFMTPDNPLGLVLHFSGYGLTMGQVLSLPMILAGLWFLMRAKTRPAT